MTLILPSKACHTANAAFVLNSAVRKSYSFFTGLCGEPVKAWSLRLSADRDGDLNATKLGFEKIIVDDAVGYVFSDSSVIIARKGVVNGHQGWFAYPQVFRLSSKPLDIEGKLVCSTMGGARGRPRVALASPTWPRGDCEAQAVFSPFGFYKGDEDLARLRAAIETDIRTLAAQIPDLRQVSDMIDYHSPNNVAVVPGFTNVYWISNTVSEQIKAWSIAFLKSTGEPLKAYLSSAMLLDGDIRFPDVRVCSLVKKDKFGEPEEVKSHSKALQAFLETAPWGGPLAKAVAQNWVQDSSLRNSSRMRSTFIANVYASDPSRLSGHDILHAFEKLKDTLHA